MESDNLLEEIECRVTDWRVGEVGDCRRTRPADDGNQSNTSNDGTLYAVHQEDRSQNTTAEDANPHGGVAHFVAAGTEAILILHGRVASCQINGGCNCSSNQPNTRRVCQTDQSQEETDTDGGSKLDGGREGASEPLSQAEDGEGDENKAFDKDSSESDLVRNLSRAVETNDGEGEVRIETHTRRETNGQVGKETHAKRGEGRDGCGCGDQVTFDFVDADEIVGIGDTKVLAGSRTNTVSSRLGDNAGVHCDDVGHGEEGRETA